jgi:hypothetical protein
LQLFGERARRANLAEVEVLKLQRLIADGEAAGEQGVTSRPLAVDMVARHCDEL